MINARATFFLEVPRFRSSRFLPIKTDLWRKNKIAASTYRMNNPPVDYVHNGFHCKKKNGSLCIYFPTILGFLGASRHPETISSDEKRCASIVARVSFCDGWAPRVGSYQLRGTIIFRGQRKVVFRTGAQKRWSGCVKRMPFEVLFRMNEMLSSSEQDPRKSSAAPLLNGVRSLRGSIFGEN